jgi:hypothetical protein
MQLDPMPSTLAALREVVSRERRKRDRRWGKPDTRIFRYERRVGERRAGREGYPDIEDDMIIEVVFDAEPGADLVDEDLTQIRELIHELRPAELGDAP